ncbi:MAG: T9SS type A sorting domain-containing protein, partial [Bacteroidia bacterium]|nr:T9SS type A sorting domain-containing protein [Bacteroidia bacterium]
ALTYTWFNGSTSSAISVTAPSSPGPVTYLVAGTNTFGCLSSVNYSVNVLNCTGLIQISDENVIFVCPNPAKNVLYLKTDDSAMITDITIRDSFGKTVYTSKFTKEIQINELQSGIYFITVNFQNSYKPALLKFIKE